MSTDSKGAFEEVPSDRALRDLLLLMPLLPVGDRADIDYNAADPALLLTVSNQRKNLASTVWREAA